MADSGQELKTLGADSIILEEEIDPNYVPTDTEVEEYAKWLDMDLNEDKNLLWIAREGLMAPLPNNWKPCKTKDTEDIYYFNFESGESTWDHPCDGYYKKIYEEEKKKLEIKNKQNNDQSRTKAKSDVELLLGKAEVKKKKKKSIDLSSTLVLNNQPLPTQERVSKTAIPAISSKSMKAAPLPGIRVPTIQEIVDSDDDEADNNVVERPTTVKKFDNVDVMRFDDLDAADASSPEASDEDELESSRRYSSTQQEQQHKLKGPLTKKKSSSSVSYTKQSTPRDEQEGEKIDPKDSYQAKDKTRSKFNEESKLVEVYRESIAQKSKKRSKASTSSGDEDGDNESSTVHSGSKSRRSYDASAAVDDNHEGELLSHELDLKSLHDNRPKRKQEDKFQREERIHREEHLKLMAELKQEWEEEVRLHHTSVRKQRSEMMKDIEKIEMEYEEMLHQHREKMNKIRAEEGDNVPPTSNGDSDMVLKLTRLDDEVVTLSSRLRAAIDAKTDTEARLKKAEERSDDTVKQLELKVLGSSAEVARLNELNRQLQEENTTLMESTKQLTEQIASITTTSILPVADKEEEIAILKSSLAAAEEKLDVFAMSDQTRANEVFCLQIEITSLKSQVELTESKLKEATVQYKTLETSQEEEVGKLQLELTRLQEAHQNSITADSSKMAVNAEPAGQDTVSALAVALAELDREKASSNVLADAAASAQRTAEALKQDYQTLQQQYVAVSRQLQSATEALSVREEAILSPTSATIQDGSSVEVAELRTVLKAREDKIQALIELNDSLRLSLTEKDSNAMELNRHNLQLSENIKMLATLQHENDELRGQLESSQTLNRELMLNTAVLRTDSTKLRDSADKEVLRLQIELEKAVDQLKIKEAALSTRDSALKMQASSLQENTTALVEKETIISELKSKISSLEKSIAEFKHSSASQEELLQKKVDELQQANSQQWAALSALQSELTATKLLAENTIELKRQLREETEKMESLQLRLEQQQAMSSRQVADLLSQLAVVTASVEATTTPTILSAGVTDPSVLAILKAQEEKLNNLLTHRQDIEHAMKVQADVVRVLESKIDPHKGVSSASAVIVEKAALKAELDDLAVDVGGEQSDEEDRDPFVNKIMKAYTADLAMREKKQSKLSGIKKLIKEKMLIDQAKEELEKEAEIIRAKQHKLAKIKDLWKLHNKSKFTPEARALLKEKSVAINLKAAALNTRIESAKRVRKWIDERQKKLSHLEQAMLGDQQTPSRGQNNDTSPSEAGDAEDLLGKLSKELDDDLSVLDMSSTYSSTPSYRQPLRSHRKYRSAAQQQYQYQHQHQQVYPQYQQQQPQQLPQEGGGYPMPPQVPRPAYYAQPPAYPPHMYMNPSQMFYQMRPPAPPGIYFSDEISGAMSNFARQMHAPPRHGHWTAPLRASEQFDPNMMNPRDSRVVPYVVNNKRELQEITNRITSSKDAYDSHANWLEKMKRDIGTFDHKLRTVASASTQYPQNS